MVKKFPFLLRDSINVLHCVLLPIFAVFMLDVIYDTQPVQFFGLFALIVFIPIKTFIYAGIYGSLVEVVSKEEPYIDFNGMIKNAKQFWGGVPGFNGAADRCTFRIILNFFT